MKLRLIAFAHAVIILSVLLCWPVIILCFVFLFFCISFSKEITFHLSLSEAEYVAISCIFGVSRVLDLSLLWSKQTTTSKTVCRIRMLFTLVVYYSLNKSWTFGLISWVLKWSRWWFVCVHVWQKGELG